MNLTKLVALLATIAAFGCTPEDAVSRGATGGKPTPARTKVVESATRKPGSGPAAPARRPQYEALPELDHAYAPRITDGGWGALAFRDDSDHAKSLPLRLVRHRVGEAVERYDLPCRAAEVIAENPVAGRVAWVEGAIPKQKLRLWDLGMTSEALEGIFKDGALGESQALILTGRMDRRGWVERANGRTAFRHRGGKWSELELPGPAEAGFAQCFWDVTERRGTDDFVLLQICAAPGREFAYAVFRLEAGGDEPVRIPFDNAVFSQRRMARGSFVVDGDGTINLGNLSLGRETGETALARLRPGANDWAVVRRSAPTRMMSSVGTSGDRVLMDSGPGELLVSRDGGKVFETVPLEASGSDLRGCSQLGCLFATAGPARVVLRRW